MRAGRYSDETGESLLLMMAVSPYWFMNTPVVPEQVIMSGRASHTLSRMPVAVG